MAPRASKSGKGKGKGRKPAPSPERSDILISRDHSTKVEGDITTPIKDLNGLFAEFLQKQYGLAQKDALDSISSITAYIPHREEQIEESGKWVAAKVDNSDYTMADLFSPKHTGLLIFETNEGFNITHGNKETGWEVLQSKFLERQEKTMQLLEEELQKKLEAESERSKQVQQKLEAEAERSKQAVEKLRAELDAEKNASAAVAQNLSDVNCHIANGACEDTEAFYRIRIRHLIDLVQGRLAFITHLATSPDDQNASLKWRNRFTESELDKKIQKATDLLNGVTNITPEEQAAVHAIIKSDALQLLVDDTLLRSAGNTAAHPGPMRKDNVEGYRTAVKAVGGTCINALESCVALLLVYAS